MPAALEYLTDTSLPAYRALEEEYAREYDERKKAIDLRWRYYRGDMHRPLKIESDGVDDNVILPKVAEIADKIRSFLLGDGVQFDADDTEDGKRGPIDEQIDALWDANRGKRLLADLALSGILGGHVWCQVLERPGQLPRILSIDPRYCSAFWNALDVETVLWYRLQYEAGGVGKRIDYVRVQGDQWVQYVYGKPANGSQWTLESGPERLEYLPLVEWPNQALPFLYYGSDDVTAALALNDAINLVASDYARILKHHASPRTIGLGMDAAEVVASEIGGFFTVNKPTTEANIYNLEMQSDLKSSYEYLLFLIRQAWHSGRMVDPQTVRDALGQLTNFGLRVMMQDSLSKTEDKRQLYGEGFERLCKLGLQLMGQTPPETVEVTWPDVLPEDPETVKVLQAEVLAGLLDKQSYREMRNYDNEQIEERLKVQQEADADLGTALLREFERGGAGQMPMRQPGMQQKKGGSG